MDYVNQIIILCNSKMKNCRTVVSSLGTFKIKLRDFAIDPTEGFIFLSRISSSHSGTDGTEILRFLMDGSDKLSLFNSSSKLFQPSDLTLDVAMKRIYFLDNSLEFIQESDYNGKNRKFLQNIQPLRLQRIVFYDNIFYAISGNSSLVQIDKSTNRVEKATSVLNAKFLRIFARQTQPKSASNVCSANSNCDQLCVPIRNKSSTTTNIISKCLCSEGFEMRDEKCVLRRAKKLLFYVQKNPQSLRAIDVENVETKVIVPIVGLDSDTTYDVDMRNRRIYFASHPEPSTFHYGADAIEFRSFDGVERGILKGNFGSIQSMAYDWKGKNIFFTTGAMPRARIAVIRVDRWNETSIIRTLVTKNIVGPTTIALSPDDGSYFSISCVLFYYK